MLSRFNRSSSLIRSWSVERYFGSSCGYWCRLLLMGKHNVWPIWTSSSLAHENSLYKRPLKPCNHFWNHPFSEIPLVNAIYKIKSQQFLFSSFSGIVPECNSRSIISSSILSVSAILKIGCYSDLKIKCHWIWLQSRSSEFLTQFDIAIKDLTLNRYISSYAIKCWLISQIFFKNKY